MTTLISEVRFIPAPDRLVPTGLLGWVTFAIDGRLLAGGIALRRSRQGRLCLSYPARSDGVGRRWAYLKPLNDATRRAIETQVLAHLGEAVG